jgi:hypothetical protein
MFGLARLTSATNPVLGPAARAGAALKHRESAKAAIIKNRIIFITSSMDISI